MSGYNPPMKKQYQNIGSQLANLHKNKNVISSTINRKCFDEKTYLDLVIPYSDLIAIGRDKNGKHIYPETVDFSEYIEFNRIDESISNRLRVLIGAFEKMMKNFLMHKYCSKMKSGGDKQTKDFTWASDYAKGKKVFDLTRINNSYVGGQYIKADAETKNRRRSVLRILASMADLHSKNNMVNHYQNKYGYVPMFVAIHSLSMGQLITLFSILPRNEKEELLGTFNCAYGKHYSNKSLDKFEKDIVRIHVIRNIVNHYESIFPFIQNTDYNAFGSLTDLLAKLKRYYRNCVSFPKQTFLIRKSFKSNSQYSLQFHIKIERVIEALS